MLPKVDQNLLYLVSEQARLSLKDQSQQLHKSSPRLKYSLAVLERAGILQQPFCIFDYSYFGLILFRVYFRGGFVSEQDKARIIQAIQANRAVISVCEFTGEFDLGVEFAVPNPSKFNKEIKQLSSLLPTLNDYKIVLNLVTYISPRYYLTTSELLRSFSTEKIIGGDRERETFTAHELAVVKSFLFQPLIRFTKLAQETGLNNKTAKSIYKGLLKRKIIKGFSYVIDTNQLGITRCRLFLKLHNLSLEKDSELTKYVLSLPEVVQINKTVGDWDMEIELEAFDKNRIRYLMMGLREKFKEIVERFTLIEIYNYTKKSYLPPFLFEPEPK